MNLDIIPNGAIKRVHVSQNDVGRTLTFELFNNSTSYTIPIGATVKIQGTKPSGLGFSETCTWSGSTVTIDTTEAMTDEFGYIEAELQITNSGDVLGTSNFVLVVERNPHPDNTTDGTQITAQSLQVQIDELAEIIESGGSGLTDEAKQALLNCFDHVAWIDEHGQNYYDALEEALYPPANLVSISAVYTQSGTVYDTDTLDSLKTDLVVTATYDDSSTATVTSYTLSGTLTTGTSTITVSYGGKTTTFNVTVTHATNQYSVTNALTHVTNSNNASTVNESSTYTATLTADTNYAISSVSVTMGGNDITSTAYSNGTINIASVSGNIVITATATPYVAPIYSWNFKNSLTDTVGGVVAILGGSATQTSSGVTLTSANDYLSANIGLSTHARRIEIDIASYDRANGNSHGRIITHSRVTTSQYDCGVIWRSSNKLALYEGSWIDTTVTDITELSNSTITYDCYANVGGTSVLKLNGTEVANQVIGGFSNVNDAIAIGGGAGYGGSAFNLIVTAMRVYELS